MLLENERYWNPALIIRETKTNNVFQNICNNCMKIMYLWQTKKTFTILLMDYFSLHQAYFMLYFIHSFFFPWGLCLMWVELDSHNMTETTKDLSHGFPACSCFSVPCILRQQCWPVTWNAVIIYTVVLFYLSILPSSIS